MKKLVLVLLVASVLVITGCDKSKGSLSNPAAPSTVQTSSMDLSQVTVVDIQRWKSGNNIDVNVYGNIGWALQNSQVDQNGANLRIRDYSTGKRVTYIVGVFNSAPIGNSNDTLYRDLPTGGKVDLSLILEPYGCADTSCWDPFTYPDQTRVVFEPDGNNFRLVTVNGEVRIQGDLPPVSAQ